MNEDFSVTPESRSGLTRSQSQPPTNGIQRENNRSHRVRQRLARKDMGDEEVGDSGATTTTGRCLRPTDHIDLTNSPTTIFRLKVAMKMNHDNINFGRNDPNVVRFTSIRQENMR